MADKAARRPDAERTKADILKVARAEFAEHGLSGGRVDAIAAGTRTTKRMIYYYFGSKEGLYLAVLEQAYREIRQRETELDLAALTPVEAMRRVVELTIDHHESAPDFIRLVSIENIHYARHLQQSEAIRTLNNTALSTLAEIIARGRAEGVFTRDVDAIDMHMLISSVAFFRLSNRHTFGTLFGRDIGSDAARARHKEMLLAAVFGVLGCQAAG
jgi:AcrR family transcriptional regulator